MNSAAAKRQPAAAPRPVLFAIVGMVVLALAAAVFARLTDSGVETPATPLRDARSFLFQDAEDGSVLVRDAATGELVRRYAPGSGGFTRGMLRGMSRRRGGRGISLDLPYVIGRRDDGRLILRDPATATDIVLDAFGRSNRSVFEALIAEPVRPLQVKPLQLAGDRRS